MMIMIIFLTSSKGRIMTDLPSFSALQLKYDDVIPKEEIDKALSGSEREFLKDRAQAAIYSFNQEAIKIIKLLDQYADCPPLPTAKRCLSEKPFQPGATKDHLRYFLVQRCKWWTYLFHMHQSENDFGR